MEYITFGERHRRKSAILQVDRQWYGVPLYWVRDDAAGVWHPSEEWPHLIPGVKDAASAPLLLPKSAAVGAAVQSAAVNGPADGLVAAVDAAVPVAAANGSAVALVVHPVVAAARSRLEVKKAAAVHSGHADATGVGAAAAVAASNGVVVTEEVERRMLNCLVLVDVDIPLVALSDGVHARSFAGNGLVVYHGEDLGLVLVSEDAVVVALSGG